jgi:hypothetical protein
MHAKYLVINNCCYWKAIETISECFPEFYIEPSFAFIIKSINPIDTCAFVISSQQKEVFWVFYFIGE